MPVSGLKGLVNSVNEENKDKIRASWDTAHVITKGKGTKGVRRP